MARLGDILRRFRRHGVPGAPVAAAVPAEPGRALEAELEPVFAALEETQRRAEALVAAAEREAGARVAAAVGESQRAVAEARAASAAARAGAAADRLTRADTERQEVLADGDAEAARVRRVAAARLPALVERVVARALAAAPAEEQGR